ncbi:tRNA uridine-5-carboxymethylaminomethyl(34) synthesis GTPase MnmE [Sphingomonas sp.]|uniref:tRNA uridine-5-carboxymethylaminomethyl(34) synthesis GTPase MnmE n=1 Tax=Sphingomonas sp. TaxID=28214 RepID=UPI003B3B21FA
MSDAPPAPDTIFALSSGALPAAIAVVRVSGPGAAMALRTLAGRCPPPRRASVAVLRDAAGAMLDRALLLWFPGPETATGEDLAEFHLHGGRAVAAAVLGALATLPGLRPAEAGEFSRRAFHNGRLDLGQVEGLADLLSAETERQRRQALRQAEGAMGRLVERWRETILALSAQVEAALQFGEEEDDVPLWNAAHAQPIAALHNELSDLQAQPPAERLRDGVRVLFAGPVNAGKSSLFNALVGRDAAIVSAYAGTTRDVIEAPIQLGGVPIVLIDSAGLRDTHDPVERIGVDRAQRALAAADLVLWLGDPAERPEGAIVVHGRADLPDRQTMPHGADLAVSAETGMGVAALRSLLAERASEMLPGEDQVAINARQTMLIGEVAAALAQAKECDDPVLVAVHLATARAAVDRIVGNAGIEDMLDGLFGRFCIGK